MLYFNILSDVLLTFIVYSTSLWCLGLVCSMWLWYFLVKLTFVFLRVCNCSMFCCMLLYVHSSFAIILMVRRELVALLSLSSWCLMVVVWLFLAVPWVCLQFVIVEIPDHTYYFSLYYLSPLFKSFSMILKNGILIMSYDPKLGLQLKT